MNTAQQIHFALGVHNPLVPANKYRLATAERFMRNWITGKNLKARNV